MLNFPSFFNAQVGGYEIEQSLRFDGTAYLTRTNGAGGNLRTFTQSFWVKEMPAAGGRVVFEAFNGAWTDWSTTAFGGGALLAQNRVSGTTYGINSTSSGIYYRDPGAWRHVVISFNNAVPTMYVNGSDLSLSNNNSSDWYFLKNGLGLRIGARNADLTENFQGYLAEIHFVDGQALAPTDFGEYDNNGVWRPIEVSGLTYGTNGFYLKFDPSATNGIGHDHSGNGNNFSPTGFTTSGTGTDVMSDTPTNNYCTFNPLNLQGSTLSNGNLNATLPGRCAGTIAVTSGKWYWECKYNAGNGYALGLGIADVDAYYPADGFGNGVVYFGLNGNKYVLGTISSYSSAYSGGHFGIALDLDSAQNTIEFFLNGSSKGTINIPDGRNWTPIVQGGSASTSGSWDMYIDENTWTYTPPTGFKALNTANLPAPTIKDGSEYFNTVLWTGNGTTNHAITGVGFQPDFVWGKRRNGSFSHALFDKIRGGDKRLVSNLTNAEDTLSEYIKSFDTDGFTLGTDANLNLNTGTYVAWNWKEGATQGFDIISYTGNGVNGRSIAHSLGVTPAFIIVKNRDSSESWAVWHKDLGSAIKYLVLNNTAAAASASAIFGGGANEQLPDSTNFYIGSNGMVNANNADYIAYCFAEVEGYSKFGSYTGNGSTDGTFVYCGFKPRWIMIKAIVTGEWQIVDTERSPYNVTQSTQTLEAQDAGAESTFTSRYWNGDILSNGWKYRGTQQYNATNRNYVYMAFAEHPLGGDGVSPATAR